MTSIMMSRSYECPHCSTQFEEPPVPHLGLGEVAPPLLTDGHRFGMYPRSLCSKEACGQENLCLRGIGVRVKG